MNEIDISGLFSSENDSSLVENPVESVLHVEGLPDEVANSWIYIYRGYSGELTSDGFPSVEDGSSYCRQRTVQTVVAA